MYHPYLPELASTSIVFDRYHTHLQGEPFVDIFPELASLQKLIPKKYFKPGKTYCISKSSLNSYLNREVTELKGDKSFFSFDLAFLKTKLSEFLKMAEAKSKMVSFYDTAPSTGHVQLSLTTVTSEVWDLDKLKKVEFEDPWDLLTFVYVLSSLTPYLLKNKAQVLPGVYTPYSSLTKTEQQSLRQANFNHTWAFSYPVDHTTEEYALMKEKVENDLKWIPDAQLNFLQKRMLVYKSDGNMLSSQNALNNPRFKTKRKIVYNLNTPLVIDEEELTSFPIDCHPIYWVGECWALNIGVKNRISNENIIFVTTYDDLVKQLEANQPEILDNLPEKWGEVIYVCNRDWCERNRNKSYDTYINLSDPYTRNLTLSQWLLGPFSQREIANGGQQIAGYVIKGSSTKASKNAFMQALADKYQIKSISEKDKTEEETCTIS